MDKRGNLINQIGIIKNMPASRARSLSPLIDIISRFNLVPKQIIEPQCIDINTLTQHIAKIGITHGTTKQQLQKTVGCLLQ